MCLAATKFVLQKINSGVWFIQTFLQKMLYMPNFPHTSSTINMQIMNQFHTHSQKKQNPAKKFIKSGEIGIAQRRRRWDCAGEARLVRSSDEQGDRRLRSTRGAIVIDEERARNRDRRGARSFDEPTCRTIAPLVDRRLSLLARRTIAPLSSSSLPLFDLGSLSLSLSLWKWFELKIRV